MGTVIRTPDKRWPRIPNLLGNVEETSVTTPKWTMPTEADAKIEFLNRYPCPNNFAPNAAEIMDAWMACWRWLSRMKPVTSDSFWYALKQVRLALFEKPLLEAFGEGVTKDHQDLWHEIMGEIFRLRYSKPVTIAPLDHEKVEDMWLNHKHPSITAEQAFYQGVRAAEARILKGASNV